MSDPSPVLIEAAPSEELSAQTPSILVQVPLPTAVVEVQAPELVEVQTPGVQGPPGPRGNIGPQGVQGPQGSQGPIGLSQQPLRIPFDVPSMVWSYDHNLGFPPSVRILDSAGTEWESDVFTDNNRVTVTHGAPFSGVLLLYA